MGDRIQRLTSAFGALVLVLALLPTTRGELHGAAELAGSPQLDAETVSLTDHLDRDPSAHIESLIGLETLYCASCLLLQQKPSGSHLTAPSTTAASGSTRTGMTSRYDLPAKPDLAAGSPRAPPLP